MATIVAGLGSSAASALVTVVLLAVSGRKRRAGGGGGAPGAYSSRVRNSRKRMARELAEVVKRKREVAERSGEYEAVRGEEKTLRNAYAKKIMAQLQQQQDDVQYRYQKRLASLAAQKNRAHRRRNKGAIEALRRQEDQIVKDAKAEIERIRKERKKVEQMRREDLMY